MSLLAKGFSESFERGSSPVDWCEENYVISKQIAEYYNTISNVIFVLFPLILIHLFSDYAKKVHFGINIVWAMLMIVGLSSAYFHATLSLIGQLLDELSILWVYTSTMIFFCPRKNLPRILNTKAKFTAFMLTFAVSATLLCLINPIVNAFALMLLSVPTYYFLYNELKRIKTKEPKVYKLGVRTVVISTCAIIIWINDRLLCDFYTSIRITYLHAVWHILIFLSSYCLCVLFAYFFVETEKPNTSCKMSFWPRNELNFTGIPYIEFEKVHPMSD